MPNAITLNEDDSVTVILSKIPTASLKNLERLSGRTYRMELEVVIPQDRGPVPWPSELNNIDVRFTFRPITTKEDKCELITLK